MKFLIALFVVISSQYVFAGSDRCNFTLPPGRTEVQVLRLTQFVEHTPNQTHTVYSCGSFVNDGSVNITPTTKIIELNQGACALAAYPGLSYIVFCDL